MRLNELKPAKGSKKAKRRVGRGPGSGTGKTAGYGHKGQKARTGGTKYPGFEGGQTPMQRRFPKRGFKNFGRLKFSEINVGDLEKAGLSGEVTAADLKKGKVISDVQSGLRVLGVGEIKTALTIHATHFSKSAKAKIEAAGGKTVIVPVQDKAAGKKVEKKAAEAK